MQGADFVARRITAQLKGKPQASAFTYHDKGSMATISRFSAVANIGRMRVHGFIAWLLWLFIHLLYLVGFFQRVSTFGHWLVAFIGRSRTERAFTTYQTHGVYGLRQIRDPD